MFGVEVLRQQIRFALGDLKSRNGHHEFEHLCRDYARLRIGCNVLPATGPVSAGGDGGSDFTSFIVFTAQDGELVRKFACTLTREADLPQKIRSDIEKIASKGPVDAVYAFCGDNLQASKREQLIAWADSEHGVNLTILDRAALAEDLSDESLYWIAQQYLALPARDVLLGLAGSHTPTFPRAARQLVGRDGQLSRGVAALTGSDGQRQVVVVSGPPGVGKSEFAMALGQAVAPRFPDGCLLVEAPTPASPDDEPDLIDLLSGALDGGVARPQETRRQQIARLKARFAGRKMLVLLDNVTSEQSVQDVLNLGSFAVVCTSRSRLTGLLVDEVAPLVLEPLPNEDAALLASRRAPRLTADEALSLADVCGGLPLAVLIAAAHLGSRPTVNVRDHLARLADPDIGMETLTAGRSSMTAVIELSYRALGSRLSQLVQTLGLLPNTSVPLDVIAAAACERDANVSEEDERQTARLLDDLYELNLVEQPEADAYRLHDVVYRFARSKAATAAPAWRANVIRSGCAAYRTRMLTAASSIGFTDPDGRVPAETNRIALTILEGSRVGALAMAETACKAEQWDDTMAVAEVVMSVLRHFSYWDDFARACRCVEQAGQHTGNRRWIAVALLHLGTAEFHRGNTEEALALFHRSGEEARAVKDLELHMEAYTSYGRSLITLGQPVDGIKMLGTALSAWRRLKNDLMLAQTLSHIGMAHMESGRLGKAEKFLRNGMAVARRGKAGPLLTVLDTQLAVVLRLNQNDDESLRFAKNALVRARAIGSRELEAAALLELGHHVGEVHCGEERIDPVMTALRLHRESGDVQGQVTALRLAGTRANALGRRTEAAELLDECVRLALSMGDASQGARAMALLARIHNDFGHLDRAAEMFTEAGGIAESTGNAMVVADVQMERALAYRTLGQYEETINALLPSMRALAKRGPSGDLTALQSLLGEALIQQNRWSEAAQILRSITESPAGTVAPLLKASAFRHLGTLYSRRGLWDEAVHAIRIALKTAEEHGSVLEQMYCHTALGASSARNGSFQEAMGHYDRARLMAEARQDFRTFLTIHVNQATCAAQLGDHDRATGLLRKAIEISKRFGIADMEASLHLNLGSTLAAMGDLNSAVAEFTTARQKAESIRNTEHVASAEKSLARALLSLGNLAEAADAARRARALFESYGDWNSAARALILELRAQQPEGEEDTFWPRLRQLWNSESGVSPGVKAALPSILDRLTAKTAPATDVSEPGFDGRRVNVSDQVRAELAGVDLEALCAEMEYSRRSCFVCGLPIAPNGTAELLLLTAPEPPDVVALVHRACSASSVWKLTRSWPNQLRPERLEIECALMGPDGDQASIIVDLRGGLGFDVDGKPIDVALDHLTELGFEPVDEVLDPTTQASQHNVPTVGDNSLTAHLSGNRLTITDGETTIMENTPLSFLPQWYRAAKRGVLLAVFGRGLQGMSWESLDPARRAAAAGRLVIAAIALTVTPPGRSSACVCEHRTRQKFKRCCGRPQS